MFEVSVSDDLYMLPSENRIITIHNMQSTKMNGILVLAERYGISPSQIVASGDDCNDMDMLRSCGVGVAVGSFRVGKYLWRAGSGRGMRRSKQGMDAPL